MTSKQSPTLLSIIAHARAGALDRAWEMFRQSGLEEEGPDPRVLAVKGRLLKDKAQRGPVEARGRAYLEAAQAYSDAAQLDGSTYPLINAASLALLAGDAALSRHRAQAVLDRLDASPDEPETPFYMLATRAEALLLLGEQSAALAQLVMAIEIAPRAWEDHASTLRQFALILAAQGEVDSVLDPYRPPRAIHYTGHIHIGGSQSEAALRGQVDSWLKLNKVGFAFGALAAGADIVIAEAVLAAGGELHVILPADIEGFARRSVEPYGGNWRARFDTLIDRAETIRTLPASRDGLGIADIALADRVAMGLSIRDAEQMGTYALQLLVLREGAESGFAVKAADQWRALGLQQAVLQVEQAPDNFGQGSRLAADEGRIACAVLAIAAPLALASDEERMGALGEALGDAQAYEQSVPPGWHDEFVVLSLVNPGEALAVGLALAARGYRIGADMFVGREIIDPLSGLGRLRQGEVEPLLGVARTAIEASLHASESFAMVCISEPASRFEAHPVCEVERAANGDAIAVFALRPRSEDQV